MIRFMHFPKCSTKRMTVYTVFFVLICFVIHVVIMQGMLRFADTVSTLFTFAYKFNVNFIGKNRSNEMKYVLVWRQYYLVISPAFGNIFSRLDCPVRNCIFTTDKNLLGDYSLFDAILFDDDLSSEEMKPAKRSSHQLYTFTTIESSYTVPVCELSSENFYNWTFTYRLDSDVPWFYFVVTNSSGSIVAPNVTVNWKTSLEPVKPEIKAILGRKKKVAVWLVSHCATDSLRNEYLTRLQEHLSHYGLAIDVYGKCTHNLCPNFDCEEMIKQNYHFYMAFENSFAKDYVTEKVLHAYDNYAIPIVYGSANYSRFLPPGSYINAREVHPYNLAFMMDEAIKNPELFESYFRWTNLYKITSDRKVYHPLCHYCEALHSDKAKYAPPKKDFRIWWMGQNGMKWCLPDQYWNESAKVNVDATHLFKLY